MTSTAAPSSASFAAKHNVGVCFPVNHDGKVSTTATSKKIWCSYSSNEERIDAINAERNWRFKYHEHVFSIVSESAKSTKDMVAAAQRGLDAIYDSFDYVAKDGTRTKLKDIATCIPDSAIFHTGTLIGTAAKKHTMEVPYQEKTLSGEDIVERVNGWARYGSCEPSAASALEEMAKLSSEDLNTAIENNVIVLLGATSELGPLETLMELGFTVVCVARNGRKLSRVLEKMESFAGTIVVPLTQAQESLDSPEAFAGAAGADLLADLPALCKWVTELYPEKRLIFDNLAYLDGESGTRVCVAMDVVSSFALDQRQAGKTGLAYLVSPATVHPTSYDSFQQRVQAYKQRPWWSFVAGAKEHISSDLNAEGTSGMQFPVAILQGIVLAQGPNYLLSKSLQQWRAIVTRFTRDDVLVSANLAPACRTASVVHAKQVAVALEGQTFFKPNMVFDPATASAVMAWLLVYDVTSKTSVASPAIAIEHPSELFTQCAVHGGNWRNPYDVRMRCSCLQGDFVYLYPLPVMPV
eukprot:m.423081 g.423081  ORF g.423081 m.423081 type:complete len:524 (-) comp21330_c0_seq21:2605-4176(-)